MQGQPMLALQDPMRLAESSLMVPESIAPLLGLLDGSRDLDALRVAFGIRTGVQLTPAQMEDFIHQLDEACLLDSRRFHLALDEVLERYRSTPFRTPTFAGEVYPAEGSGANRYLR